MSDLPMCFVCFDTDAPAWPDVGEAVMQRLPQPWTMSDEEQQESGQAGQEGAGHARIVPDGAR